MSTLQKLVALRPFASGTALHRHFLALPLFLVYVVCCLFVGTTTVYASTELVAFGEVWRVKGSVDSEGPGGQRTLRVGDSVFVGDFIKSSPSSEAVLKTKDGGFIAVRPGAQFRALRFVASGESTDQSHLELLKGSLRLISGWIGKLNPQGSTIRTPTATVGIRGTDHEPYVLLADEEQALKYRPGTYDKVNQGGTTLLAAGQTLEVNPGQVGFARAGGSTRALMTLLFPVILERVPGFYVPGEFDSELDVLSKDATSQAEILLRAAKAKAPQCVPTDIAKQWLGQLDKHIVSGNSGAILAMFSADARVKATVRGSNGAMTELVMERAEFADSVVAAVSVLRDYQHRRITLEGSSSSAAATGCGPILARSVVIEEGRQAGKPYRFESEEFFQLTLQNGQWIATRAETRQR